MRYSLAFDRDYEFYLKNRFDYSFSGKQSVVVPYDKYGATAKKSFFYYDSNGKIVSSKDNILVQELITCKASINLHIKMYAQSMAMGVQLWEVEEIANDIDAPSWFMESVIRQAYRFGWLGNEFNDTQGSIWRNWLSKQRVDK